ncbi:hypothetical protein HDU87_004553 [Geranomyces variabilis]|uniref:Uncharacterized protein n=1 Tax=Geranomyces variabilis TaxID=109894 RepID=A0AAD5XQK2_9FUNG|nr:hypothetical protein HDU87_004553 [Geranomyces variabilis]
MAVKFEDRSNSVRHASFAQDYGRDLAASQSFLMSHLPNSSFVGFYNTHDESEIALTRDFSAWKWVVFPIAALPLSAAVFFNTLWLIGLAAKTKLIGHALKSPYPVSPPLDIALTSAIWIGFIFPVGVLTPVQQVGYLTPEGQTALTVCIPIIACLGWTPLFVHYIRRRRLTRAVPTAVPTHSTRAESPVELDTSAAPPAYSPRKG